MKMLMESSRARAVLLAMSGGGESRVEVTPTNLEIMTGTKYVSIDKHPMSMSFVRGNFSVDELEAVVAWMRDPAAVGGT